MIQKSLRLRVTEAEHSDVGRKIVRLLREDMKLLDIDPGDVVELEGPDGKKTAAKVLPLRDTGDRNQIICMDGFIRKNSNVSIGDFVTTRKASLKVANSVTVAPAEDYGRLSLNPERIKSKLLEEPLTKGDFIALGGSQPDSRTSPNLQNIDDFVSRFFGPRVMSDVHLIVSNTDPEGLVIVKRNTKILIQKQVPKHLQAGGIGITYEEIGGLGPQIQRIREMIELPMKHPQLFDKLGIDPPKGVLLHGPPGTGKTMLAKAVASESSVTFFSIAGPEIMSKFYGESEQRLRNVFQEAEKNAPSIIFIDELDSIAPKREEVTGEVERRVVAQLLALMDGLKSRGRVILIGATNRPNALDPALRRPGRFDREIELGVPTVIARKEILQIHTRKMPLGSDVDLELLARKTHGFVGADIAALARESAMITLRKILPEIDPEKPQLEPETLAKLIIKKEDFFEALRSIEPSAMREIMLEIPNVKWSDVGGLNLVKQKLIEAVEWPIKYPEKFQKHGVRPPRGVLLYGPPGTGKTLLAKAVATESEANFIAIRGPELLSKWVGESEKAVREIFRKAKQSAPSIIFLDEIDSIAPKRGSIISSVSENIVNQLLTLMDGLETLTDVVVLAATNRPDRVDMALLRPGRFDQLLLIEAPDKDSRYQILKIHTRDMRLSEDVDLKELARSLEGYCGADIESICRESVMICLRENLDSDYISKKHFIQAIEVIHPSITKETMEAYRKIKRELTGRRILEDSATKPVYG